MKKKRFNERTNVNIIFGILIAILVASGWVLIDIVGKRDVAKESIALLMQNYEAKENTLSKGRTQLDKVEAKNRGTVPLMNRVENYKKISNQMLSKRADKFRNLLDYLIEEFGMTITSVSPGDPTTKRYGNYSYEGQAFTLQAYGTYQDIGRFLSSFENKVPLMEVTGFSLNSVSGAPKQLNIVLTVFVVRDIVEARTKANQLKS